MLLVVDVGNTQTHFGVYPNGGTELDRHWRFATVRESTRDELGAALANLLALRDLSLGDIDRSIVSSTVPQLSQEWTEMARLYLDHEMLLVGPSLRTGMPIRTDNPREVGADRLVNAVAAFARFSGACIVVDFGTAITYDVVSEAAEVFAGQVEGIVRRLRAQLGGRTPTIATGGLAGAVVPYVDETIDEVDELLTLTGLRLIWERNAR